jgi:hypothetical protein
MNKNPLIKRLERKASQPKSYWQSKNNEKKLAVRIGGRKVNGSGNKIEKGDVRKVGIVRIEHKTTSRKSFSVTREMIDKIVNAGLACNEVPAIVIEFIDRQTGKSEGEVACIPVNDLVRLLNDAGQ